MKIMMIAAAIVMFAAAANAQDAGDRPFFPDATSFQTVNASKIVALYHNALSSDNLGVVESALAHAAMLKLMLPRADFKRIKQKVNEISQTAQSVETRYKAFLVRTVLEEPGMFYNLTAVRYGDADEFFGSLASKMSAGIAAR